MSDQKNCDTCRFRGALIGASDWIICKWELKAPPTIYGASVSGKFSTFPRVPPTPLERTVLPFNVQDCPAWQIESRDGGSEVTPLPKNEAGK